MSAAHPTCEDSSCAICRERVRLVALKIERGLRPAGNSRLIIARIKERVRRLQAQGRA